MTMRLLLSYHYYAATNLDDLLAGFRVPLDLFADSGGYSAETLGHPISVEEYIEWCGREGYRFSAYANLDIIGDAEATWVNQQKMEAAGLTPVPVFHGGEPWSYLERYLDRYPYVALGGMVAKDQKAAMRWAVRCFQMARAAGVVYHGFGQTRIEFLRNLPWYSVDSSSWASAHRFGTLMLWDDRKADFLKVEMGNHREVYRHAALIRAHGGVPEEIASPKAGYVDRQHAEVDVQREVRARIIAVNARAWLRLEDWLRRHHGPVGPPNGSTSEGGPQVLLATGRWGGQATEVGLNRAAEEHAAATGPKVFIAAGGTHGGTNATWRAIKSAHHDGVISKEELAALTEQQRAEQGPKMYLAQGYGPSWESLESTANESEESQ